MDIVLFINHEAAGAAVELALRVVLEALHHHTYFDTGFCHRCECPAAACAVAAH